MSRSIRTRQTCAQFGEMLTWLQRGWQPAPPGYRCPECGGPIWLKKTNRFTETHQCVFCLWGRDFRVK